MRRRFRLITRQAYLFKSVTKIKSTIIETAVVSKRRACETKSNALLKSNKQGLKPDWNLPILTKKPIWKLDIDFGLEHFWHWYDLSNLSLIRNLRRNQHKVNYVQKIKRNKKKHNTTKASTISPLPVAFEYSTLVFLKNFSSSDTDLCF